MRRLVIVLLVLALVALVVFGVLELLAWLLSSAGNVDCPGQPANTGGC